MASVPFAFSVDHFIKSVGADAGFASIIGLAILVLLYFAQARETSSLREQAYEWAQRVQQLENRVAQLSRGQSQQAPADSAARPQGTPTHDTPDPAGEASDPTGSTPGAAPARSVALAAVATASAKKGDLTHVGAPAGVGAPALTAATKLIPAAVPAAQSASPGSSDLTAIATAPATVAGGANGAGPGSDQPQAVGAPAGGSGGGVAGPVAAASPPRIQIRPSDPGAPDPTRRPRGAPHTGSPSGGRSVSRWIAVALGALLLAAAVVVGLLLLNQSGSNNSTAAGHAAAVSNASGTGHPARTRGVNPANVTVSVLNGTPTSQLAHRVAENLAKLGYKLGTVATAADQTRTSTIVAYLPGHRHEALAVASSLKLGPASLQPVDPSTQAVACPPSTRCSAGIVVTVGSDLTNTP